MFARKMIFIMTIAVLALMNIGVRATQYYVSTDGNDTNTGLSWAQAFATVGKGITTASDDDVIDVNEGEYTGTLNYNGKAITIRSTDPNDWEVVADTEITATAVLFQSSEEANSVLLGCSVDGQIVCGGSGPTINKCIIMDEIYCYGGSSAVIENNKISNSSGNGVNISSSSGLIRNNWIYDCSFGILFGNATAAVDVNNNTIVDNSSAGIKVAVGTAPNITNCILWDNTDDLDGCSATYSCIEDCTDATGTGNICGDGNDPKFAGWMVEPYYLAYNSPCIDKGDPNGTYSGQTDIEGDNRVVDGRIDMGADEFIEFLPPFGCENEPGEVNSVNFGGADPNYEDWTNLSSTIMSDPCTDPNDGTITYRELLAGYTLYIDFPFFNLDAGYDPNDPNDPNSLPLTEMLLEIMYRDTVNDNTTGKIASWDDLVIVYSKIDYINLDPNYVTADFDTNRYCRLIHLGGSEDGNWKYMQYGFQRSDFQLIRAIGEDFTIKITNKNENSIPINYVSLRKITQDEYEALTDKQRQARCFYEVELPADAPNDPNYDDPNMVIFSRDVMRPVYQHTQPDPNEPNSISGFGVWGQVEPVSFSIYSEGGTDELAISVCDLQHTDGNTISSGDITISRVIYDETRLNYIPPSSNLSYALVPERLEELAEDETFSVDANTSQRLWLKIDVPDNSGGTLPSGLYEGTVTVDPAGGDPNITIDIEFTVYDMNLLLPEHINTVCHDPFTKVYSSDLDEVFKAYYETGFDPFIYNYTH
ncbi:MAG: right-handed parallel beta-helix repeat-containing protein, partial [Planctomycetota bacterium]